MDRFWSKVDKTNDCWLWTANTYHNGYGCFSFKGRNVRAHRFSYEQNHGPIPENMYVLHKCDNPRCVRPSHLFLGTAKDNTKDMLTKGRHHVMSGEKHYCAVLTTRDVYYIKQMFKYNFKLKDIAQHFKVNAVTISDIYRGKTWKHIGG